jgi:hypothetical protein
MIGGAAGVVELLLVPHGETRTRFHAAQGLALHLFVLAVGFLFNIADKIADNTIGGVFSLMLGIASLDFTISSSPSSASGRANSIASSRSPKPPNGSTRRSSRASSLAPFMPSRSMKPQMHTDTRGKKQGKQFR